METRNPLKPLCLFFFAGREGLIRYTVLMAVLAVGLAMAHFTVDRPHYDGRHYAFMAYNLVTHGTVSTDQDLMPGEDPLPSLRREPMFPFLLAGMMAIYPGQDFRTHGKACLLDETLCPQFLTFLKIPNLALHVLLICLTGWAAGRLVGRRGAAYAGVTLAALFTGYLSLANIYYAETLASVLFLLTSMGLYLGLTARRPSAAAGGGLALGLLILTKAAFFYFLIVCLMILAGMAFLALFRTVRWGAVARAALYVLLACAVIAPWMVRNHAVSGEWKIAGRGGEVLSIRASYDTMPWSDYLPALMYFTPIIGEKILLRTYGEEVFARLDRESDASYYQTAKDRRSVAHVRAAEEGVSLNAAALEVVRENFGKHLALTAAFMYRGAFAQAYVRDQSLPLALILLGAFVALWFVPAGLAVSLWAPFKDIRLWVFLFPAYFSYAFHAFLTHYIPRYSTPLIPVFMIALIVFVCWILEAAGRKKKT